MYTYIDTYSTMFACIVTLIIEYSYIKSSTIQYIHMHIRVSLNTEVYNNVRVLVYVYTATYTTVYEYIETCIKV